LEHFAETFSSRDGGTLATAQVRIPKRLPFARNISEYD
jgi:hypothetical protein